jgi:predicted flavoprotein YhiN
VSYFKVKAGTRTVSVPVYDAVRVNHASVQDMADRLILGIERDRKHLMFDLKDTNDLRQYFVTTGDVMLKAIVSRSFNGVSLHVELYVCKVERFVHFEF